MYHRQGAKFSDLTCKVPKEMNPATILAIDRLSRPNSYCHRNYPHRFRSSKLVRSVRLWRSGKQRVDLHQ